MNFSYERPTWMTGSTTGKSRRLIAGAAAGVLVLAIGIPAANAATGTPTLGLSTIDGLVVVQGSDFAEATSVKLDAKVTGGSGTGTVTSKANGTFAAAFEPPEGFTGSVTITAAAGSDTATKQITMSASGSTSSSDDSTSSDADTTATTKVAAPSTSTDSEESTNSEESADESMSSSSDDEATDEKSASSSSDEESTDEDAKSDDSTSASSSDDESSDEESSAASDSRES